MSIADLKTRLHDVPGIETLSMQMLAGRQNYNNGRVIQAAQVKLLRSSLARQQREELWARLAATKMSTALRQPNEAALATIGAEATYSPRAAGFGGSDLPDRQKNRRMRKPVHPFAQKYSASRLPQIKLTVSAVSSHMRGGSRSSRTRGGMRWTRQRRAWKGIAVWASACERSPSRRRPALIRLR